MRAMEYTPAKKRNDGLDMYFVYRTGAAAKVWTLGPMVDELIKHKKLTDAECAAEYWRAEADRTGMRNGEGVGWSSAEVMDALEREVEVWHRFATYPHASEVE